MWEFGKRAIEKDSKRTPEDQEKLLNEIGLSLLKKFVKRKDYRNALLERGGKKYRITSYRKGRAYVLWAAYGDNPPQGINSNKITVKELMEEYKLVTK